MRKFTILFLLALPALAQPGEQHPLVKDAAWITAIPADDADIQGQLVGVIDSDGTCSGASGTESVICQSTTTDGIAWTWELSGGSGLPDPVEQINFDISFAGPPSNVAGQVYYCDGTTRSLCVDLGNGVTLQIGHEMYLDNAINKAGVTILDGQPVYICGRQGSTIEVCLAQADSAATAAVVGLATEDILNNAFGKITTFGLVRDFDTSLLTEDEIYLDETTIGTLTNTVPVGPNATTMIGDVINSHPSQGIVFVHIGLNFAEAITLLSAYLTGELIIEDGLAVNSDSDAVGDFSIQGDTVADLLKCVVSTDSCTYQGFDLGIGTASDTEILYSNVGVIDGSTLIFDGSNHTFGSGRILIPDGALGSSSLAFASQLDLGIYKSGTDSLGFDLGPLMRVTLSEVSSEARWVFNGDSDTYFHWIGSNKLGVHAANARTIWDHPGGTIQSLVLSRVIQSLQTSLTPAAAPLSAMDDGTTQMVVVNGTPTNADDVFRVDADGDGTLTDGGMVVNLTGQILSYGGNATTPGYSFQGSESIGMYHNGTTLFFDTFGNADILLQENSVGKFKYEGTGDYWESNASGGPRMTNAAPSATVPSLLPNKSDATTGIGGDGSDNLYLITGGATGLTVEADGDAVIRTGNLLLGGATHVQVDIYSANQTLTASNGHVVVDTTSTMILPACTVTDGRGPQYTIKVEAGSGAVVTIDGDGIETIDEDLTAIVSDPDAVDLTCYETGKWSIS